MKNLSIKDMFEMQDKLYEKHTWWGKRTPETGQSKLLWMFEEMGEVVALIKKKGKDEIMNNPEIRSKFITECADVLMYFNDVLKCYGFTPEDISEAYQKKVEKNLTREFHKHKIDPK